MMVGWNYFIATLGKMALGRDRGLDMAKKKGEKYTCEECGMVVIVEDVCGCEECDITCCDVPMVQVKAKKKVVKPAAKKKPAKKKAK
jgi:hypothetical protein